MTILHKLLELMSLQKVSDHVAEPMKAFVLSGLTTLSAVSIQMDWIDVGTRLMGLVSITALGVLNLFILGNYIYRKFFRNKSRETNPELLKRK